jgi:ubiquinone/menaquinone biosynthesis C-methylase UbiE
VDYDRSEIAANYDEARALTPQALRQWQGLLARDIDAAGISLIVDLGCGTGRFSELLAAHFAARVVGIDPSQRMIAEAHRKAAAGRIAFQRAAGEALPLAAGCADLVFMSQAYHHFAEPAAIARQCRRVLHAGGHACIRNTTREADFPARRFFPALRPLLAADLPAREDIMRVFVDTGFSLRSHRIVTQVTASDWRNFAEKCALRADSFLARLPDEEFAAGMTRLRAHAAASRPGEAVSEELDWFVFTIPAKPN